MPKLQDDNMGYTKFLHAAYDLSSFKKNGETCLDTIIILSDFVPELKSLNQFFRFNEIIPLKFVLIAKMNTHSVLDKLKARICLTGVIQIKDESGILE